MTMLDYYGVYLGGRIRFRTITADDGWHVAYWRNMALAREMFFDQSVVTPESHAKWLKQKDPYDQVWVIEDVQWTDDNIIGMLSLIIEPHKYIGEYGRLVIAPEYQGLGYAKEAEYTLLATAFDLFQLQWLWLDAFTTNDAVLSLHDKTGWRRAGVDVKDHTHARGAVQHMTYNCEMWRKIRAEVAERYEWTYLGTTK